MVYGYAGKVLRVDLTDGAMTTEEPPASFYRRYIGGNGFVAYYTCSTWSRPAPIRWGRRTS